MPFITVDEPSTWDTAAFREWAEQSQAIDERLAMWLAKHEMSGELACAPISLDQRRELIAGNILTPFIELLVRFHSFRAQSMYKAAEAVGAAVALNAEQIKSSQPDSPEPDDIVHGDFVVTPRAAVGRPVVARISPTLRVAPFPLELLPPSVTDMLDTLGMLTNMALYTEAAAAGVALERPVLAHAPPASESAPEQLDSRNPPALLVDSSAVVELRGLKSSTSVISVRERRRPRGSTPLRQQLATARLEAAQEAQFAAVAFEETAEEMAETVFGEYGDESDDYVSDASQSQQKESDVAESDDIPSDSAEDVDDMEDEDDLYSAYFRGGIGGDDDDDMAGDNEDGGSNADTDQAEESDDDDDSTASIARSNRSADSREGSPSLMLSINGDAARATRPDDDDNLDDLDDDEEVMSALLSVPRKRAIRITSSAEDSSATSGDEAQRREKKRMRFVLSGGSQSSSSEREKSKRKAVVQSSESDGSDEEEDQGNPWDSESDEVDAKPLFTESMINVLKDHQTSGVDFAWTNLVQTEWFDQRTGQNEGRRGCILAHAMGAGKTLQAIILAHLYLKRDQGERVLIVVPSQLESNWANEIRTWKKKLQLTRRMQLYRIKDATKTKKAYADWEANGGILLITFKRFCRLYPPAKPDVGEKKNGNAAQPDAMEVDGIVGDSGVLADPAVASPADPAAIPAANGVDATASTPAAPAAHKYIMPHLLMIDEAHLLKNPKTIGYRAVEGMQNIPILLMTGSPLQNHLLEYHSMSKLIVDNLLPPIAQFREQFVAPINAAMQDVDDVSAMRVAKRKLGVLRRKMDQVLHRVTRQEVMGGDFDSYVILCRQSPLQREATVAIKKDLQSNGLCLLDAVKRNGYISVHPRVAWEYLCKPRPMPVILSAAPPALPPPEPEQPEEPLYFEDGMDVDEAMADVGIAQFDEFGNPIAPMISGAAADPVPPAAPAGPPPDPGVESTPLLAHGMEEMPDFSLPEQSPKMLILLRLVQYISRDRNEKVLIFVEHREALSYVERMIKERLQLACLTLSGHVTKKARDSRIRKFMRREKYKVLILTKQSGSVGLNLTAATRVIICEASWNPVNDEQAICRAHRLGQQRRVFAYHLLGFNTLESTVFKRGIQKTLLRLAVVDNQPLDRPTEAARIKTLLTEDPEPTEAPSAEFQDEVLNELVRNGVGDIVAIKRPSEFSQRDALDEAALGDDEEGGERVVVRRDRVARSTPARRRPPKPRPTVKLRAVAPSLKLNLARTPSPAPTSPGGPMSSPGNAPSSPSLKVTMSMGSPSRVATPPPAGDSPSLVVRLPTPTPSSQTPPGSPSGGPLLIARLSPQPQQATTPQLPKVTLLGIKSKYL